jgi:exodeoxyribonuclease VII large subunit
VRKLFGSHGRIVIVLQKQGLAVIHRVPAQAKLIHENLLDTLPGSFRDVYENALEWLANHDCSAIGFKKVILRRKPVHYHQAMAAPAEHVYSPSELNREIKLHLEAGFPRVVVEAEISNLARPASGHLYFSLKDDRAQIRCAMFRSSASRMGIEVANGSKVLARGRISLYEPRGDYQLIIDSLQDAGEGLFDPAFKQPLAPYPARIGLITSPSGAAVRDLLHVMDRRWPVARIRLYPVLVQGNEAPVEIFHAIEAANRQGWAETLIIGRGGGSLEDLAAFNDEAVARAVFASSIPVISAVGHETDFSICDFVADLRAPTPSAAAELATPDQTVLKESFARMRRQLLRRMRDQLQQNGQKLDQLAHRLQQRHPANRLAEQEKRLTALMASLKLSVSRRLGDRALVLDSLSRRLSSQRPERKLAELLDRVLTARRSMERIAVKLVSGKRVELTNLARTLNAVSPLETIGRGYAVISSLETGEVITSSSQTQAGDRISAQVRDGRLDCTVDSVRKKS